MKKILVLIFLIFSCCLASSAEVYEAKYCPVAQTKDTGNGVAKLLSNVTGINFASSKAAELAIQKVIKTQLGSKTNIEITPYSIGSLINGKFKKMTIESKSLNLAGLYVSKFDAGTVCDYNQVGVKENNLLFKENFVMGFSSEISNGRYLRLLHQSPTGKLQSSI